jgi:hypothetical protein
MLPFMVLASTLSYGQYCTPTSTYGCAPYGDEINNFILSGLNGTAINDVGSGCSTGSYANETSLPPVDMVADSSYTANVSTDYYVNATNGDFLNIWIDFNDNNTFEATEMVTGYGQMIGLSGSDVTLNIPASAPLGVHRMRVSMYWVNKSTVTPAQVNACNTGTFVYTYGETQDYSINIVTVPLPIILKSISAENVGNANEIIWSTSLETRGDYFELERSKDGKQFSTLTNIESHQTASDYKYTDNMPSAGTNYYRLKVMAANGKYFYSSVVNARASVVNNVFEMSAYPNPTSNYILLKVKGAGEGTVKITDVSGRGVYQSKMTGSEMNIDISRLASGCYLVHYDDGTINKVIKVNKQ